MTSSLNGYCAAYTRDELHKQLHVAQHEDVTQDRDRQADQAGTPGGIRAESCPPGTVSGKLTSVEFSVRCISDLTHTLATVNLNQQHLAPAAATEASVGSSSSSRPSSSNSRQCGTTGAVASQQGSLLGAPAADAVEGCAAVRLQQQQQQQQQQQAAMDPFGGAAATALPPRPRPAPLSAAGYSAQPLDPFGGAAAAPPTPAAVTGAAAAGGGGGLPDPFGSAAVAAAAPAAALPDPFGSAAAAAGAWTMPDPFGSAAAAVAAPPTPSAAGGLRPAPDTADFAAEYAAFGAALPAVAALLPPGINTCTIGPEGDCQLEDLCVGEGSFGTVRMGYYYDDPVAVKLMRPSFGADPAAEQHKLLREVQLQASAGYHGGIVRFVAVCFDPPAIVMERCECSLEQRIRNHWPLAAARQQQQQEQQQQQQQPGQQQQQVLPVQPPEPSWRLVVQLLRQAAAALAFLHRQGQTILHNDLRAANMVLTQTYDAGGVGWRLKLCDFGLAVNAGAATQAQVAQVTHASWRAPEVDPSFDSAALTYKVTRAADVYALGCVLHEMLAPGLPQPQFPDAQQRLPGLDGPPPADLQALFEACVAQQAVLRPSAQMVLGALRGMAAA